MKVIDMLEEHISDIIPAYALEVLDSEETQRAALHLENCPTCQRELAAYRMVVADLALASPQRLPPPHLKDRLMKHIQPSLAQKPASWRQQVWQRMKRLSPAWSLTSLVLILILTSSNLLFWQQSRQHQPKLRSISLNSTEAAPGATGLLVFSMDGQYGTLVVDGLPSLNKDQQYQLWLIEDGQRTSGGVFTVGLEGYSSLWVDSPKPLSAYQGFGITIEPFGGSPGPTGAKVLVGQT